MEGDYQVPGTCSFLWEAAVLFGQCPGGWGLTLAVQTLKRLMNKPEHQFVNSSEDYNF